MHNCESKWTSNTLQRTSHQAQQTLIRTRSRNLQYPKPNRKVTTIYDPVIHSSIDETFSLLMKSLSDSSRRCLRYYKNIQSSELSLQDQRFCAKYLKSNYIASQHIDHQEKGDGTHLMVSPGTYNITTGSNPDEEKRQTRVISIGQGETAVLNFNL